MKQVFSLVHYELKNVVLDSKVLLYTVLAPFIIISCFVYGLSPLIEGESFIESFDIAIVNEDSSIETRTLLYQMESSDYLKGTLRFVYVSEQKALSLLHENKVAAVVTIPQGFSEDLMIGKNTPIRVLGNHQRPLQSIITKEWMESGAQLISAAQSGVNTVYYFLQKTDLPTQELNEALSTTILQFSLHALSRGQLFEVDILRGLYQLSSQQYYILSGAIILLHLWTIMVVARFNEEFIRSMQLRLRSYGLSFYHVVWSRFFILFSILSLKTVIVCTILGFILSGFSIFAFGLLILFSLFFTLTLSSLYLFFMSLASHPAIRQLNGFMVLLWMAVTGGSILPLSFLPSWVKSFSYFSTNTWANQGFVAILWGNGQSLWPSFLALSIMLVLFLSLTLCVASLRERWEG